MHSKKLIGLVVLAIGVGLMAFAMHSMYRITEAKKEVNDVQGLISDNPVGSVVGKDLQKEVSQYDVEVMWALIGGVVLVFVGGGTLIFARKRK